MSSASTNPEFDKSLKSRLIMPFVLLLLLTTTIIALLSFQVGSHALSNLSEQLLTEQAERISQVVDRHMYGSGAVLETAFPLDMRASEDIRHDISGMQERFWTATSLYPESNNYVYYGNIRGQGYGLSRHPNQQAEIRMRTRENQARDIYSLSKIDGVPEYSRNEDRIFDPRSRPWFKTVQQIQHHTWTAVYVDFSSTDLVVTRARQVMSNQEEFVGVVATDLSLSALNKFVRQLKVSENARTAIVEPNGQLIAASFTPNLTRKNQEQIVRVNARATDDALFNELLNKHLPNMAKIPAGTEAQLLEATAENGDTMLIAYKRITDDAGLDWIAMIIQPYADVISSTVRLTFIVSMAGLI
ncbi:cache domain-containing protein, partial [Oceanospirillum sp. HFRX-1_2]